MGWWRQLLSVTKPENEDQCNKPEKGEVLFGASFEFQRIHVISMKQLFGMINVV